MKEFQLRPLALTLIAFAVIVVATACAGGQPRSELKQGGSMKLRYARQLAIDEIGDGCYEVDISDGQSYLLIPRGKKAPDGAHTGKTVVQIPAEDIYLAASSAMDLFRNLGALDSLLFTSTDSWEIDGIDRRLDSGSLYYIGKYSSPDYEALLEGDCSLAVESTMIYHTPRVKEELEALGIPVIVERSSYEDEPLGRLEWIKLYGILTGQEEKAEEIFEDACSGMDEIVSKTDKKGTKPKVAFFSIGSRGNASVRRPGDYITRMIDIAGGEYVPESAPGGEGSSAFSMQLEDFAGGAMDADILIYNSAIMAPVSSIEEICSKSEILREFDAVRSQNVWCTKKSVFQETAAVCGITYELSRIISDDYDESEMEYFHKLK